MVGRLTLLLRWCLTLLVCVVPALSGGVSAQNVPNAQDGSATTGVQSVAQVWLDAHVASAMPADAPLRMEVSIGQLDRRLKLAPCDHVEPYLPHGTRLWGNTRLGLRCVQGVTRWNVFLPVTVRAMGPAWVIKNQVAPGATLTEADVMEQEVDWAQHSSAILAKPSDWLGQTATRLLSMGQALRQDMVRAAQVFQAGAQVKVVASGQGFEVATSAQAMGHGLVGQSVKVKMEGGRVVTAWVIDGRTVRLDI